MQAFLLRPKSEILSKGGLVDISRLATAGRGGQRITSAVGQAHPLAERQPQQELPTPARTCFPALCHD